MKTDFYVLVVFTVVLVGGILKVGNATGAGLLSIENLAYALALFVLSAVVCAIVFLLKKMIYQSCQNDTLNKDEKDA